MKQVIVGWVGRGAQQRAARERAARAGQGAPPPLRPRQEPRRPPTPAPRARAPVARGGPDFRLDLTSPASRRAALDVLTSGTFRRVAAIRDTIEDGGGLRDIQARYRRHRRERDAEIKADFNEHPVDSAVSRVLTHNLLLHVQPTRFLHDLRQPESLLPEDTVVRAAANVLSGGQINEASASMSLLTDGGGLHDLSGRYNRHLAEEDARDEADWRERPVAAAVGTGLGIGMAARSGYRLGEAWSSRLPIFSKGRLGEEISRNWAFLRGDPVVRSQVRVPLSRSYTKADHLMRSGRFIEAKFGPRAELRPNQIRAQNELGERYLYEHWMPHHVGRIGAAGAGAAGAASAGNAALRRRQRRDLGITGSSQGRRGD